MIFETGKWVAKDLDSGTWETFDSYDEAFDAAARIVGNRSAARPTRELTLFGHGDGNTRVIIQPDYVTSAKIDSE